MYLKSIEILGFKSFATKTVLNFDKGVTVIVGPNGCGKSNVLDAIRWVLGEQSAKALRGGEMADVIFSGTDSRAALGMAEVSMTFADCEKDLGVAWNEVTITRRVFRDGQGEYMLNRTPCRLRDINQLFMDTGIGRTAYSIMEQGKIDQILSSRPEDRRAIFEEAAGITKFKSQRKEALRKLEATEGNLLRLTDVVREVKRQIGSLQRQAAKARRYKALLHDVRVLELHHCKHLFDTLDSQRSTVSGGMAELLANQELQEQRLRQQEATLAGHRSELQMMEERLTAARENVNELKNRIIQGESRVSFNNERATEFEGLIERYRHDIDAAEEKLEQQQDQIENADVELEAIQASLSAEEVRLGSQQSSTGDLTSQRVEIERRYQSCFAQISQLENRLSALRGQISQAITARDSSQARMAILGEELATLQAGLEAQNAHLHELSTQVEQNAAQLEERRRELEESELLLRNTQAELAELDREFQVGSRNLQERESRLDVLRQLNAEGEGFSEGTQAVLKGLDDPELFKPAILGALAQFIEVAPEFITAIEVALGQNLQAIVMKESTVAEAAAKRLAAGKAGRASLALRDFWEGTPPPPLPPLPAGALGWAVDKVKAQADVAPLVGHLLHGVALVDHLETALRLAQASGAGGELICVTLNGEVLNSHGVLLAGQTGEGGTSILQRKALMAELEKEITESRATLDAMAKRREEQSTIFEYAQQRLQESRDETQTLNLTLAHYRGQLANAERETAETRRKLETFSSEHEGIARRRDEASTQLTCFEEEAESVTCQISELQESQLALQENLVTLRETEGTMTAELNEIRLRVATEQQRLQSIQNQRQPMHARLAELREMIEQRRRDIENYTLRSVQLGEDSENVRAGVTQAQGRLGEAEEAVQMLVNERLTIVAAVETHENLLRQTRHELGKCHEQRTQFEVRSSQVNIRLETLTEHIQRRYQVELTDFEPNGYLLLKAVREQKKRIKTSQSAYDAMLEEGEAALAERDEAASGTHPQPSPEELAKEVEWSFVESVVKELNQKLEAMGPVNIDAIQEYNELEERYNFLEQQNNDLLNSKEELLEVIAKINATTRTLFAETFARIRINFQEMFTELFGGGKANLILQNEEDPLESGIEIIAKPPGKQLQSITLLSGGEKTMTAVALLFSIYMVKPSPFCVLDEMDAPLDESNINRFIKILDRFAGQSQFVVISHNKRTIAKADAIYGVTMEEHGVSKLVGVKFKKREDEEQESSETETVPSIAESFGKHGDLHSERQEEDAEQPTAALPVRELRARAAREAFEAEEALKGSAE